MLLSCSRFSFSSSSLLSQSAIHLELPCITLERWANKVVISYRSKFFVILGDVQWCTLTVSHSELFSCNLQVWKCIPSICKYKEKLLCCQA
jgi:hypothetical protein